MPDTSRPSLHDILPLPPVPIPRIERPKGLVPIHLTTTRAVMQAALRTPAPAQNLVACFTAAQLKAERRQVRRDADYLRGAANMAAKIDGRVPRNVEIEHMFATVSLNLRRLRRLGDAINAALELHKLNGAKA